MKSLIAGFVALLMTCCAYASEDQTKNSGAEATPIQQEMLRLQIQNNQIQMEILKTLKDMQAHQAKPASISCETGKKLVIAGSRIDCK